MKKLLSTLLAALSFCANAATTLPVQLINPTGSTSGQAIVSTGASSAPGWAGVNAITLNGATFASPPAAGYGSATPEPVAATTISATGAITPSYPAGIIGNVSGAAKNSTAIGYVNTSSSSAVAIATGVPTNCASVALPAGDWDIQGTLSANPAGTTGISQIVAGVSLTSATFATVNTGATAALALGFTVGTVQIVPTPVYHVSTSSAGTAYLVGQISYGTSTLTCSGFISITRR